MAINLSKLKEERQVVENTYFKSLEDYVDSSEFDEYVETFIREAIQSHYDVAKFYFILAFEGRLGSVGFKAEKDRKYPWTHSFLLGQAVKFLNEENLFKFCDIIEKKFHTDKVPFRYGKKEILITDLDENLPLHEQLKGLGGVIEYIIPLDEI